MALLSMEEKETRQRERQFFPEGFKDLSAGTLANVIRSFQQDEEGNDISRAFDMLDALAERFEAEALNATRIEVRVPSIVRALRLLHLGKDRNCPMSVRYELGTFTVTLEPGAPQKVRQEFRRMADE